MKHGRTPTPVATLVYRSGSSSIPESSSAICQRLYNHRDAKQGGTVPAASRAALPASSKEDSSTTRSSFRKGARGSKTEARRERAGSRPHQFQHFRTKPSLRGTSRLTSVGRVRPVGPLQPSCTHLKARTRDVSLGGTPYVMCLRRSPSEGGQKLAAHSGLRRPGNGSRKRRPRRQRHRDKSPYYYDQKHVLLDKIVLTSRCPTAGRRLKTSRALEGW